MRKIVDTGTIKNTRSDWGKVLIPLLDETAIIVLVIVMLHFLRSKINRHMPFFLLQMDGMEPCVGDAQAAYSPPEEMVSTMCPGV